VPATPAAGHVCTRPAEVPVGEPAAITITVGITPEVTAVVGVKVEAPSGFRLTDASGRG